MEFSTVPFKTMIISRYIQTRTFTQQISFSYLHFLYEDRLISPLHARMRNNCSNLKCDLFVNHLSETNLRKYCYVRKMLTVIFFIVPGLLTNCFTALAISIP